MTYMPCKERLRSIVDGRLFGRLVQFLIFAAIVNILVESELSLSPTQGLAHKIVDILDWVFSCLFALEYILRIYAAPDRRKYIFSFYGIIDLLAILPSFLHLIDVALGVPDLKALRVIRVLRIFKVLKAEPVATATDRLLRSFHAIKYDLMVFGLVSLVAIFIVAYILHLVESSEEFSTIISSMWWTVSILTPISAGEARPLTAAGKVISSIVSFIGVAIIAIPSGLLAASLTRDRGGKEI